MAMDFSTALALYSMTNVSKSIPRRFSKPHSLVSELSLETRKWNGDDAEDKHKDTYYSIILQYLHLIRHITTSVPKLMSLGLCM